MKKLQVWLAIVLIGVTGIAFAKNAIAKTAVTSGVKAMTGLNLTIRAMDVGLLKSAIRIGGLRLENPSGFADRTMVDLPEVYVAYDLGAFFKRRVHLQEVRLHLNEFVVIKDPQGRLNLDALRVVQESKGKPAGAAAPQPGGPAPEIAIDALQLQIGTVVYKDYAGGGEPMVQTFPLNLNERYEHITNPQALAALIVSRALVNTSIARLTNLDLTAIQGRFSALQADALKRLEGASSDITGTAKSVAQDMTSTATDAVKNTTESLKKVLPFGN